jgi:hypothetical protein
MVLIVINIIPDTKICSEMVDFVIDALITVIRISKKNGRHICRILNR